MHLSELPTDSGYFVRSLGPGSIRIVDDEYSHSLILHPEHGVTRWPVESLESLDAPSLEPLIALEPEIVLLATGRRMRFPDHDLRLEFLRRSIGLEVMTLDAAARTFNVLAGEARNVVAALIWEPGD